MIDGGWVTPLRAEVEPQLVKVLPGDMSLEGLRPAVPEEDKLVDDWSRKRLGLKLDVTDRRCQVT